MCPGCGGPRLVRHSALLRLAVAHVDADAFFASVEKRDRPELAGRPVIVGGGRRGVVAAACYVARLSGVHSAMPMFQALRACPDAVVIPPDFPKYRAAGQRLREMMLALTPLVQPLSIDEADLDLTGTEAVHGAPPAVVLARFARAVETELGITVSIGLAANRMLAKLAAGRDKPRGFAVLGTEAASVLAPGAVGQLPGVGPAQARRLATLGITRIGQLQALDDRAALRLLGEDGPALTRLARGEDNRSVTPGREVKSVSAEVTFETDLSDRAALERQLWLLCERLGRRLRDKEMAAGGVVLKLKTARFAQRARALRLPGPTQVPETLFAYARGLLAREADGTAFRLIGIGAQPLAPASDADRGDLADPEAPRRAARQAALDSLRARFGAGVIGRGRGLVPPDRGRSG
jgi:DNA polymerase IV